MAGLTDKTIRSLKATDGRLAVRDEGTPGLELRVSSGGAKTFAVRYTLADGTRRRMNLGRWPALSLSDARDQALEAMSHAAKGGDPAGERIRARYAAKARTIRNLDDLADALFEAGGVRASTMAYRKWLWTKKLKPTVGATRVDDVTPGLIRRVIREVGASAGPTTANRALGLLQRMMNFGVAEEHLASNPLAKLRPLFREQSRARVLVDDELSALWAIAESTRGPSRRGSNQRDELGVSRAMAASVQLCLVTAQRGGEVAGVRRRELDLTAKTWLLPAERSKSKREHLIPLSDTAVALFQEAIEAAEIRIAALKHDPDGDYALAPSDPVFPSPRNAQKSVARLSLGRAMARLCAAVGIKDASPHDLRRTAATVMASERIGALTEVVSRVLNHAPPGLGVTGVYNRHAYVGEKRTAMVAWEGVLLEIVGERDRPSNVSQLRAL